MKVKKDQEIMLGVPGEEDAELDQESKKLEEMAEEKFVELQEHRAMVHLPENAVEVTIQAKVFHNDGILSVKKEMKMEDIREAFRKADDGYIDDDDMFVITEKGREFLAEKNNNNIG